VEVIIGSVVRMARDIGYPTPLLDFTYTMLKGLQQSILDKRQ
jgi:2-dehydropantoate 2-reductase